MSPETYAEQFIEPVGVGHGWQEVVKVPNPGAGNTWSFPIAGQYVTRPVVITLALGTAAGGAARTVIIEYQDTDGNVLAFATAPFDVAPNGGALVSFAIGAQSAKDQQGSHILGSLPDVFLEPGRLIVVTVANMAGGDSIAGTFLTLDRLPTGQHVGRRRRRLPAVGG